MKQIVINHLIYCLNKGGICYGILFCYLLFLVAAAELIVRCIYIALKFTWKTIKYHHEKINYIEILSGIFTFLFISGSIVGIIWFISKLSEKLAQ